MDPLPLTLSDIDTSRAFRTDDELLQLVAAIHGSRAEAQETNWLEWKSGLDLTKAPGKFAVAKAVLGFANRSVDDARVTTGGVAYMVVGVEPGAASGIAAVDHANLTPGIKTYASTPRFTPRTVRFGGVEVLVVMVEPPEPGDLIHSLQKQYDKFDAGVVFHRGHARTAPAGPKEIEMLADRRAQGAQRSKLDLALRSAADPLHRLNAGRDQVLEWLSRHEAHVRAVNGRPPEPEPTPPDPASAGGLSLLGRFAENAFLTTLSSNRESHAATFDNRVKTYLAKLSRVLLSHLFRAIAQDESTNTVHFQVGNETEDPVLGVQLALCVPKDRIRVYTAAPRVDSWPEMPKWPDPVDDFPLANMGWVRPDIESLVPISRRSASMTELDDSFEVTWDIGDLRPGEWSRDLTITVVAGPSAPDLVSMEMVARSTSHRGQVIAKKTLTVSADEWTVDDFFAAESE